MDSVSIILWIAVMIAMLVLEAATVSLVSIWFAGGALSALIVSLCGGNMALQIVLFVVVSGILLACLRPLMKKLRHGSPPERTNADRVLDMEAVVVETIDNLQEQGAVKVDGKIWTARTVDGSILHPGQVVQISRMEGVKLYVTPAKVPVSSKT
ncbi:MAG: NfeD family protein [Oscillospiraceae bacterium]|nr:NfeD family protein [Oscillospiraceae bacterium]